MNIEKRYLERGLPIPERVGGHIPPNYPYHKKQGLMLYKEGIKTVTIVLEGATLHGHLYCPDQACGLVVFSHGSGSSRWSPRNNYVAGQLHKKGLGTLLFDLLTEREDHIYETRFDIDLLTRRLISTTIWLGLQPGTAHLPLGYFGASTAAPSALKAASYFGGQIKAVVSRGGRPDLAMDALPAVSAPTLLIVGEWDHMVIELNEKAYEAMRCKRKLEIIPEASHLFEEPGKLEAVADLSARWFMKWLPLKD